eukprot:1466259-Prymnesium_polylepis.1
MPPAPQASGGVCPDVGTGWTAVTLDPSIDFIAYHKVQGGDTLHLRLSASTVGWLGFGFAEPTTGHMKGSDLVTASVTPDGIVHAQDCYADFAYLRWNSNLGLLHLKPIDRCSDPCADRPTTYSPPDYVEAFRGLTALWDAHNDWAIVSGREHDGVTE